MGGRSKKRRSEPSVEGPREGMDYKDIEEYEKHVGNYLKLVEQAKQKGILNKNAAFGPSDMEHPLFIGRHPCRRGSERPVYVLAGHFGRIIGDERCLGESE